ncbi:hypothetical protein BDN72DRAFT_843753 [Pluteus cervinus]|uniref:Uncharacterized protein n=1 Tax=Pluteus cervinus TaxID=181527 RepID=A0ACD3AMV4_9AGAR|nr:hypothetical protein BDN72DRAFT_843753 [Pluteus cervinus]
MTQLQLPTEILELILCSFRPTCNIAESWRQARITGTSTHRSNCFKIYTQSLAICAQLRLVNRTFHDILTPLLYSLLVIPAQPQSLQKRRTIAAEHHPELIKAILFDGIVDAYISSATSHQSDTVQILKPMLDSCTHLASISIDLSKHPAWAINKVTMNDLFKDLPVPISSSGLGLTSLALLQPNLAFLGALIDGLGKRRMVDVKELLLSGISLGAGIGPMQIPWTVPQAFSSLERLGIWLGRTLGRPSSPDALLQFLTQILEPPPREDVDVSNFASATPSIPTITTSDTRSNRCQLRELTISEGHKLLDISILGRLFKIGNIGESLTTLQLRLFPPISEYITSTTFVTTNPSSSNSGGSWQLQPDIVTQFDRLPSSILQLCPRVTHFHYLTWCPESFLLNDLPGRIVELGVRIAEDLTMEHPGGGGTGLGLPPSTLRSVEPLIQTVGEAQYRRGLKRLYVEWGLQNRDEADVENVRIACETAGVVFLDHVDF